MIRPATNYGLILSVLLEIARLTGKLVVLLFGLLLSAGSAILAAISRKVVPHADTNHALRPLVPRAQEAAPGRAPGAPFRGEEPAWTPPGSRGVGLAGDLASDKARQPERGIWR